MGEVQDQYFKCLFDHNYKQEVIELATKLIAEDSSFWTAELGGQVAYIDVDF